MKIIIFSDIHGNQYALDAFLREIEQIAYDKIVFCGDVFGYYYGQREVIERLEHIRNLIWIKGNHDIYAIEAYEGQREVQQLVEKYGHSYEQMFDYLDDEYISKLKRLSSEQEIVLGGKKIGIFHGTPEHSSEGRLYPADLIQNAQCYQKYDYVISGHTHFKMQRKCGNTMIVNPGSLGQQRDGRGAGYAVLDVETGTVEFRNVEYTREKLYAKIEKYDPDMKKLKEILERKNVYETDSGNCN